MAQLVLNNSALAGPQSPWPRNCFSVNTVTLLLLSYLSTQCYCVPQCNRRVDARAGTNVSSLARLRCPKGSIDSFTQMGEYLNQECSMYVKQNSQGPAFWILVCDLNQRYLPVYISCFTQSLMMSCTLSLLMFLSWMACYNSL